MGNKKIAYFIESDSAGGAETLLLGINRHIAEHGYESILLHNGNKYIVDQCRKLNLKQECVPHFNYYKSTKTLLLFALKFKEYLKKLDVDLLHSHLFGPITGAALAAKLAGIPHIGTLHDIYMIQEKPVRIHLLNIAGFLGTQLITVSKTMESFYQEKRLYNSKNIQTIYNGVSCDTLPAQNIRKKFGFNDDECLLINVGRLVPLKRHDLLIDAIHQIDCGNKKWRLIIVGGGEERSEIERTIIRYGLQDKVQLLGHRDDIDQLLRVADIFVQCSDTEGLSMSIMEAMAASLPAVVTDVGGNQELIDNNENGLVVPANNSTMLKQALEKLILDVDLREKMRETTFKKVQENFNIKNTYDEYTKLYKKFIG